MTYRAPVADIVHAMRDVAGYDAAFGEGLYGDFDAATAAAALDEAAKFAEEALAPLDEIGDRHGVTLTDGAVTSAPGFADAYKAFAAGGWTAVVAPEAHGGMGMPGAFNAGCLEMWNAACLSFALCPLLSMGAIDALEAHGSEALRALYLPKLVSGEWTGTMNLTEPGAGSDLSDMKTRATRAPDGTYRIVGQKIFITWGEHDMADNVVHLVLARLPDAPPGTRGISLFLAPKFIPGADGGPGRRNDLRCAGVENKLGIHASPTCTMAYGDGGGATAWLIGEENKGLACMFTMMNNARLGVALQGVAVGERAYQKALAFARERKQGRAAGASGPGMSPIVEHPDVRRTLLAMKAQVGAARAICHLTAAALDRARRAPDPAAAKRAADRAALLTPIAKAYATDVGVEVASQGVQVHGGMGFVEETGAARHYRDARILPIYEGTNGIQAIDLAIRKLPLADGAAVAAEIADISSVADALRASNDPRWGRAPARLDEALAALKRATAYMAGAAKSAPESALAGATDYLRLFALARGAASLVHGALALGARGEDDRARVEIARFHAEHHAPAAAGLADSVIDGAEATLGASQALAS
ncbi:MAG: acyl-CoA dehydrogenase family protein [Hyphomicrobiales bacterium]|nr:acyl-CoA dehydrogenase family protein [Hyphomicrobiales bacterium]